MGKVLDTVVSLEDLGFAYEKFLAGIECDPSSSASHQLWNMLTACGFAVVSVSSTSCSLASAPSVELCHQLSVLGLGLEVSTCECERIRLAEFTPGRCSDPRSSLQAQGGLENVRRSLEVVARLVLCCVLSRTVMQNVTSLSTALLHPPATARGVKASTSSSSLLQLIELPRHTQSFATKSRELTDRGLFTVIAGGGNGLQVYGRDGRWQCIHLQEGEVAVVPGFTMDIATDGALTATKYRLVSSPSKLHKLGSENVSTSSSDSLREEDVVLFKLRAHRSAVVPRFFSSFTASARRTEAASMTSTSMSRVQQLYNTLHPNVQLHEDHPELLAAREASLARLMAKQLIKSPCKAAKKMARTLCRLSSRKAASGLSMGIAPVVVPHKYSEKYSESCEPCDSEDSPSLKWDSLGVMSSSSASHSSQKWDSLGVMSSSSASQSTFSLSRA